MSSKSSKGPKPKAPRDMETIKTEYSQLCGQAGQKQYEIDVKQKELKELNKLLIAINHEAALRIELDKAKLQEVPVETVVPVEGTPLSSPEEAPSAT